MPRNTRIKAEANSEIPTFLAKLWKMVENPETDDIIRWNINGHSFLILNEAKFWYDLLPQYYKHSNMSSFIRQLNMYGFHKISNILDCESETFKADYQFTHPDFQRGHVDLLKNIKRKVSTSKDSLSSNAQIDSSEKMDRLSCDVKSLGSRQTRVDSIVNSLRQENAVLWQEIVILQQKQQKYQQILNKLIQFLVTLVQPSTRYGGETSLKRPRMIQDNFSKKLKSSTNGPTIHELDNTDVSPGSEDNIDVIPSSETVNITETDPNSIDTVPDPELDIDSIPETILDHIDLDPIIDDSDMDVIYNAVLESPTNNGAQNSLCATLDEAAVSPSLSTIYSEVEQESEPAVKFLTDLDFSDDLGISPNFDISSILGNSNATISLENLKEIYFNSSIQDPILTSILNDAYSNLNIKNGSTELEDDGSNVNSMSVSPYKGFAANTWEY